MNVPSNLRINKEIMDTLTRIVLRNETFSIKVVLIKQNSWFKFERQATHTMKTRGKYSSRTSSSDVGGRCC